MARDYGSRKKAIEKCLFEEEVHEGNKKEDSGLLQTLHLHTNYNGKKH